MFNGDFEKKYGAENNRIAKHSSLKYALQINIWSRELEIYVEYFPRVKICLLYRLVLAG